MPLGKDASFAETLGFYVSQSGYSYGQLGRLSGLPKRTIAHWLEGLVARPRDWRDLLKVAAALHLDETNTTRLLESARHPGLARLLAQAENETDRRLMAPWSEIVQRRLEQAPFQVVADLPHFVGRKREIEALRQALLGAEPARLCSLHGIGGAGKTALANHLAYVLRPYFPDGVLWARLDNTDSMSILGSFARAYKLDVEIYKDIESRSRAVRELLAHKRTLIILDNAETSDQVEPLLPPTGDCAVILTSRRQNLAVTRGVRRFQLGPFEGKEESFELFVRLLGQERARQERQMLLEIAGLLGDLPLALDIAASRMAHEPGWSAADFLTHLRREENRLGELVFENQSVRTSFNISYERLTPDQRAIFNSLGVFGGDDFGVGAAAYVAALDEEPMTGYLRRFYALSLVQLGRPGRYRLHPLLRALTREGENGSDSLHRMITFFVSYTETHREDTPALDLEITAILAALEAAYRSDLGADLVRGCEALFPYLDMCGLYPQAELHLGRAIRAAETLENRAAQASLLCKLGLALIHYGRPTAAEERLQEALNLTRRVETLKEISALALGYLGLAAYYRSDYEQMQKYLLESLALARASHQNETICRLFEGLSEIAQQSGDYAAAEAYCREGLALARQLENPELICLLLKSLANAIFERGADFGEVSAYLQESLALARELGHPRIVCNCLLSLGYVACEHADFEAAETYLQTALQGMQEVDFPMERVFVLCTLGLTARGRQMYAQSAAYLSEGLALARQVGMDVLVAPIQDTWGWLYLREQKWDAAAAAFSEVLSISRRVGSQVQTARALYGLANLAAAQKDFAAARRHGEDSLAILEKIGHRTRVSVGAWLEELLPSNKVAGD